jgi:hypothetical protein
VTCSLRSVGLLHLLPREVGQFSPDLLAGPDDNLPGLVRISAVHQPHRLRKQCVEAYQALRQQAATTPPRLTDRSHVQVVVCQPVDVLDRLADPLQPPGKPTLLSRDPFGPGLADGLPRVEEPGQCCDGSYASAQIADHLECVNSGHSSIIPPMTAVTTMIL